MAALEATGRGTRVEVKISIIIPGESFPGDQALWADFLKEATGELVRIAEDANVTLDPESFEPRATYHGEDQVIDLHLHLSHKPRLPAQFWEVFMRTMLEGVVQVYREGGIVLQLWATGYDIRKLVDKVLQAGGNWETLKESLRECGGFNFPVTICLN